jgi:hypothetical protein
MGLQIEKGELSIRAVIGVISFCAILIVGFYTQVVIPIKEIQLGLAQVQSTLMEHDDKEEAIKRDVTALDKRITTNDGRLKYIESILKIK